MRLQNSLALSLLIVLAPACHKRSRIPGEVTVANPEPGRPEPGIPPIPVNNSEWINGSPTSLVGNWASSLFQDQRCTAFYSFTADATADLNVICLNAERKLFEREHRRYAVATYPGTQQIRLKQMESSCGDAAERAIKAEGVAFLFAVENIPAANAGSKLALWEPVVDKTPLNLSRADGLMADGFPGKTGVYLGMPIVSGCFMGGSIANFQATDTP